MHHTSTEQTGSTCAGDVLESCLNTEPSTLPTVMMAVTTTAISPVSFGEMTNMDATQPNA